MGKRIFDVFVSATGLILLSPILLLTAILIKCGSGGPIFFRQERVGLRFRPFWIFKFRTMHEAVSPKDEEFALVADHRITGIGQILRKTKIDELPQLVNVLKGEMSLVGPRPELPCYVALFREDYEHILQVLPGITDLASIRYRKESEILGQCKDPKEEYIHRILPDKIQLAKQYLQKASFAWDLWILLGTVPALFDFRRPTVFSASNQGTRHEFDAHSTPASQ